MESGWEIHVFPNQFPTSIFQPVSEAKVGVGRGGGAERGGAIAPARHLPLARSFLSFL